MNLHSRLPVGLTLEERADAINQLLEKLYTREQQTERLRWRVGVELYNAQKLVPRGQWETWCENNIRRGMRDIQKLLKMAEAHDPQAAHEAEKAAQRRSASANGGMMAPVSKSERFGAAWEIDQAILAKFTVMEARELLEQVRISDLLNALDACATDEVPFVSTATH